jgi:hypothetical protein
MKGSRGDVKGEGDWAFMTAAGEIQPVRKAEKKPIAEENAVETDGKRKAADAVVPPDTDGKRQKLRGNDDMDVCEKCVGCMERITDLEEKASLQSSKNKRTRKMVAEAREEITLIRNEVVDLKKTLAKHTEQLLRLIPKKKMRKAGEVDTDDESSDEEELCCIVCANPREAKRTGVTFLRLSERLIRDYREPGKDMEQLDICNHYQPPSKPTNRHRVSGTSPFHEIDICKRCFKTPTSTLSFNNPPNNDKLCVWCRNKFTAKKDGYVESCCADCEKDIITKESDPVKNRNWLAAGFAPVRALFEFTDEIVSGNVQQVDMILVFGDVYTATLEIDRFCHKASGTKEQYTPEKENEKNECNDEIISHVQDNEKRRVAFRLNPNGHYTAYGDARREEEMSPLSRWLVFRDLCVMLVRLFKVDYNELGPRPFFYCFYDPESKLIDETRNPLMVNKAVALPTTEMAKEGMPKDVNAEKRRFPDWASAMDAGLARLGGITYRPYKEHPAAVLLIERRTHLDELERRTRRRT